MAGRCTAALLLTGLYQLLHATTPEHAAVSETVEAARALGRPRAAGLVNAVLRRFQRERESILAELLGPDPAPPGSADGSENVAPAPSAERSTRRDDEP